MTKFVIDNGKNLFESYDKQEIDAIAEQKANSDDVYNKTVIDAIESGLQESIGAIQQNLADNYYQSSTIDAFFAKKNGDYDELTAGLAKQLISKVRVTDSAPYNFRTSGGSLDIGSREFDKLIGGTVAFNQLVRNGNFSNMNNWSSTNGSTNAVNNECVYTVETVGQYGYNNIIAQQLPFPCIANHKYLYFASIKPKYDGDITLWLVIPQPNIDKVKNVIGGIYNFCAAMFTANEQNTIQIAFNLRSATNGTYAAGDQIYIKNVNFIDLTQMFGATIADYIYNLESANAGAGVAFFRRLFPLPYYEYNAGELMSVKTSAHKMVGFNAFNEDFEIGGISTVTGEPIQNTSTIRSRTFSDCVPNALYCLWYNGNVDTTSMRVYLYDANYNFLDFWGFISRPRAIEFKNARYFKVALNAAYGTEYKNDICVNLSWDGERDGEYEPYKTEFYPLAQNLELRGIPKLDASNNLYYDGDEYDHTGDVKRKYGVVDLSTLDWNWNNLGWYVSASITNMKYVSSNTQIGNAITPKYTLRKAQGLTDAAIGEWAIDTADIKIKTGNRDITPTGYLTYELATPTTETAAEFANPQFVDDFGTEQYIDERPVEIPVGHVTEYEQNLRAKLEMSPDSPANDGLFLMQHNNGENSYIPYISPIPALPTTNGVYSLKCTVTGGVPVMAWVEDTATRNAPDAEPETENENEK